MPVENSGYPRVDLASKVNISSKVHGRKIITYLYRMN